jgi:hypothetical protein
VAGARIFSLAPGAFYTNFYNHAHRLRLENTSYTELPHDVIGNSQLLAAGRASARPAMIATAVHAPEKLRAPVLVL